VNTSPGWSWSPTSRRSRSRQASGHEHRCACKPRAVAGEILDSAALFRADLIVWKRGHDPEGELGLNMDDVTNEPPNPARGDCMKKSNF